MQAVRVALLYSGSVFLDGVVRRLRERGMSVTLVPSSVSDPVHQLQSLQPQAVVMESAHPDGSPLVERLLEAMTTTIICLDLRRDDLQVRTSQRIAGATTEHLMAAIQAAISGAEAGPNVPVPEAKQNVTEHSMPIRGTSHRDGRQQ